MTKTYVKKIAATATMAGALGLAAVGFGTATAQATPHDWWNPPVPPPGHIGQIVGVPPGHIGHVVGVPPGHWDKPWKW